MKAVTLSSFTYYFSSLHGIFRSFLLHGLVLGKAQSYPLRHFDVAFRALFDASNFSLGQRLAAKACHARVETPVHHIVVHSDGVCGGVVMLGLIDEKSKM